MSDGDDHNEAVHEVEHRVVGLPDPGLDSHFEYGTRAGWWRIMDVLAPPRRQGDGERVRPRGRTAAAAGAGRHRRGHEIAAHGWRWEIHAGMSEDNERQRIAWTVAAIAKATGVRPVGWHTRAPASPNTRRLLVEEGGFLYDSDAYNDDLPYTIGIRPAPPCRDALCLRHQRHAVPATNRFRGASDFADYVLEAFDWLYREGLRAPKMMSIGLHLRVIGRPGRIGALERILPRCGRKTMSGSPAAMKSRGTGSLEA